MEGRMSRGDQDREEGPSFFGSGPSPRPGGSVTAHRPVLLLAHTDCDAEHGLLSSAVPLSAPQLWEQLPPPATQSKDVLSLLSLITINHSSSCGENLKAPLEE